MNLSKLSETPSAPSKMQSEQNSKTIIWVEIKCLQHEEIKTDQSFDSPPEVKSLSGRVLIKEENASSI